MSEKHTQDLIRLKLGSNPHVLVVRRNVGTFYTRDGRPQRIGSPGEADLQGIIDGQHCPNCSCPIHPAPFAIEVKSERGKLRKDQVNWRDNVWTRRNGIYVLARDADEAIKDLNDSLPSPVLST